MIRTFLIILFSIVSVLSAQVERDQLFDEVEIYLDRLRSNSTHIICYDDYEQAVSCYAKAKEMFNTGESFRDIRKELENSVYYITKINDVLDNRSQVFSDVIAARRYALNQNADKYAALEWQMGEEAFKDAVDCADENDVESLRVLLPKAKSYYDKAAADADQAKKLLYNWLPLQNANAALANILASETYKEGMSYFNKALDNLANGGEKEEFTEYLQEANLSLDQAARTAGEFSKSYPGLLNKRKEAKEAGAEDYAQNFWMDAEKKLMFLGNVYEEGDYDYVLSESPAAEVLYTLAKHEAVKNKILNEPKRKIEKAYDIGAGDLAPITLAQSENLLNEGILLVDSDRYTEDEVQKIADESLAYADLAMRITEIIKNSDEDNPTWEQQILKWNTVGLSLSSKKVSPPAVSKVPDYPTNDNEDKESNAGDFGDVADLFEKDEAEIKEAGGKLIISLTGLNFTPTQVTLNDENKSLIDKTIAAINKFPDAEITIVGHTDNSGTKLYNKILSEKRAQEVMTYIINNSTIEPRRVTIEGHGEDEPIADNATFEGRVKNRRVDVVIDYL